MIGNSALGDSKNYGVSNSLSMTAGGMPDRTGGINARVFGVDPDKWLVHK